MNGCKFIEKFNKLRKSSSNSIDNIQIFDDFRKYMHVIRATEMDLKKSFRLLIRLARRRLCCYVEVQAMANLTCCRI